MSNLFIRRANDGHLYQQSGKENFVPKLHAKGFTFKETNERLQIAFLLREQGIGDQDEKDIIKSFKKEGEKWVGKPLSPDEIYVYSLKKGEHDAIIELWKAFLPEITLQGRFNLYYDNSEILDWDAENRLTFFKMVAFKATQPNAPLVDFDYNFPEASEGKGYARKESESERLQARIEFLKTLDETALAQLGEKYFSLLGFTDVQQCLRWIVEQSLQ